MYIREAHSADGPQPDSGGDKRFKINDPKTQVERDGVARDFAHQFQVPPPILVDTIDNKVERAYNAMPDRIYVIDAQGKIAYKGGHGPEQFRVSEVPPALDKLLGVQRAAKAGIVDPPSGPGGGPDPRQRIATMLKNLGAEPKDVKAAVLAFDRKMEAYRPVMDARNFLTHALANEKENVLRGLAAVKDAQKKYAEAAERIDKELDGAIGYSKKPRLEGALTALGLLGAPPGPPTSGLMNFGSSRPGGPNGAGPRRVGPAEK